MRNRTKPATLPFGSISSGSMRNEDVIPALLSAAGDIRMSRADRAKVRTLAKEWSAIVTELETTEDEDGEAATLARIRADEVSDELFDILNNYAPPYAYVGSHPGDGADYGVWLSEDSLDSCFDGERVSDLSEVPKGYSGGILLINDHGNPTLYSYSRGRGREIWSLV